MAKNSRLSLLATAAITASVFWACTEEENPTFNINTEFGVDSFDDLPKCTEKHEGETAYNFDDETTYMCVSGKWQEVEISTEYRRSSSLGKSSSSSARSSSSYYSSSSSARSSSSYYSSSARSSSSSARSSSSSARSSSSSFIPNDFSDLDVDETDLYEYGHYDCSLYDCAPTSYLNQDLLDNGQYKEFLDRRNGKVYQTIQIGNQIWLAQNLDYYTVDGNADNKKGSFCYQDLDANCAKYGRLYTWAAAMDLSSSYNTTSFNDSPVQGICPDGWHVPDGGEWSSLLYHDDFSTEAMQSTHETSWTSATNTLGFSAVASQMYGSNHFSCNESFYWQNFNRSYDEAQYWVTGKGCNGSYKADKIEKFSLRCVKNYSSLVIKPKSSSSAASSSSATPPDVILSSSSYEISDLVDLDITPIKESGFYDCSEHNCITTDYLNQEMLDNGDYLEYLDIRDDQVYKVVVIGEQVWMAQNLNYVSVDGNADDEVGSWSYNDSSDVIGRHYTWTAAMDISDSYANSLYSSSGKNQGICPKGWHVPSRSEWETLKDNFISLSDDITTSNIAYYLKAKSSKGIDLLGFSLLFSAKYGSAQKWEYSATFFWTSDEYSATAAYYKVLNVDSQNFSTVDYSYSKTFRNHLRCIAD